VWGRPVRQCYKQYCCILLDVYISDLTDTYKPIDIYFFDYKKMVVWYNKLIPNDWYSVKQR